MMKVMVNRKQIHDNICKIKLELQNPYKFYDFQAKIDFHRISYHKIT